MTCGSYYSYGCGYDYYGCGNHQSQYNCCRPCNPTPIRIKIKNFGTDTIDGLTITYKGIDGTTCTKEVKTSLHSESTWTGCIPCNVFSISGTVDSDGDRDFAINEDHRCCMPKGLFGNAVPFGVNAGKITDNSKEKVDVVYNSSYNCKCWDINLAAAGKTD